MRPKKIGGFCLVVGEPLIELPQCSPHDESAAIALHDLHYINHSVDEDLLQAVVVLSLGELIEDPSVITQIRDLSLLRVEDEVLHGCITVQLR